MPVTWASFNVPRSWYRFTSGTSGKASLRKATVLDRTCGDGAVWAGGVGVAGVGAGTGVVGACFHWDLSLVCLLPVGVVLDGCVAVAEAVGCVVVSVAVGSAVGVKASRAVKVASKGVGGAGNWNWVSCSCGAVVVAPGGAGASVSAVAV